MTPDRVTEKLFNYFKMSNTWFKKTAKHIEKLQITQEDIEEWDVYKRQQQNFSTNGECRSIRLSAFLAVMFVCKVCVCA